MSDANLPPVWSPRLLAALPGLLAILSLLACAAGWLFARGFDTPVHFIVMLVSFPVLGVVVLFAILIRMALRRDAVCRKIASAGILCSALVLLLFAIGLAKGFMDVSSRIGGYRTADGVYHGGL